MLPIVHVRSVHGDFLPDVIPDIVGETRIALQVKRIRLGGDLGIAPPSDHLLNLCL